MKNGLASFHPLINRWFSEKYGQPTDVQTRAWESFHSAEHFILSSPTGSGKTLAAFLAAIDNFASGVWETGTLRVSIAALDVLSQLIIGMTGISGYGRDGLYHEVRRSYPYRNLSEDHFTLVLDMLLGRYADSRIRELTPGLSWDKRFLMMMIQSFLIFLMILTTGI